mgnify:CR=1 FL=1
MPQKTNLNINPYYDDFSKDSNFYKVLFNPGKPVQARELTTLQSILQDQIESFGSHMFKEGSMVIPGNSQYDAEYFSIKLDSNHLGIPVSLYVDQLKGKILEGQSTGIKILIDDFSLPNEATGITDLTIFVKYIDAGIDNTSKFLEDGENLLIQESLVYGNTLINAGDTVANLIDVGASAIGCRVSISDGVFFIRGHFVNVSADKLVLDAYTNNPSYRVGLFIKEELVSANDDESLYDNARGFSNFAAPGADRLKISTTLTKKGLTDFNDKNFIEIMRLDDGELKKLQNKTQYNLIKDYFAKRTYEESGNYSVGNFKFDVEESLNDGISNEGVFNTGELTDQGATPTDDLFALKVSPGKAYVRGYDIERPVSTILDIEKPRDKKEIELSSVPFKFGNKFQLNNVNGTPKLGINIANTISLSNQRKTTANAIAITGTEIGRAKVYAFENSDAAYTGASTKFDLYLYDVQTYTSLVLNTAVSSSELPDTAFVEGLSSGASGFARNAGGNSASILLEDTSGTFIVGEQIRINGLTTVARSIKTVTAHRLEDIKSVYQNTNGSFAGFGFDFSGDLVLKSVPIRELSPSDEINISGSNVLTCAGKTFGSLKVGDHITYSKTTDPDPRIHRISAISADLKSLTLAATTAVSGVNVATLGADTPTGVRKAIPVIQDEQNGLFAKLENKNVSDVSLTNSDLSVKTQITGVAIGATGVFTANITDTDVASNAIFETFDEERYSVHGKAGDIAPLTSDQVTISNNGQTLIIQGLTGTNFVGAGATNIVVNATVRKNDIKVKQKSFDRSKRINVTLTNSGISTANGLTQNTTAFGLRVEDKVISLNIPDVINVVGVFESLTTIDPVLDRLVFVSGLALNTASVLGEKIIGSVSGAVAQITSRVSATIIEIAYLTQNKFTVGETVTFEESQIITNLQGITEGSYLDVTSSYTLDKGHRQSFMDYSRIVRNAGERVPNRRLSIIVNHYTVPSNDVGDVYTVGSYDEERFSKDVPLIGDVRATDTLDFRPRVAEFTATTASPFDFGNRNFSSAGTNPTLVVTPNEASKIGYKFYLPRTDKLILDPSVNIDEAYTKGEFEIIKGISSENPTTPEDIESGMTLATIEMPPYLYDVNDVKIKVVDNRRFTMRDIGKIEDRVSNLETVTSLSLLELDTKTLQVQDADGLTRFKSGFFVDDFKNNSLFDLSNPDCKSDVDSTREELITPTDFYSLKPELALDPSIDSTTADFSSDLTLLDSGIKKTGDLITLDYEEATLLNQPLASRAENVNPFAQIHFEGGVVLSPSADTWTRNIILNDGTRQVFGDRDDTFASQILVSSEPDTHIRSRNVGFNASRIKPNTRFYAFFDSSSGLDIIPKLIEITMNSGVFQINETVEGFEGSEKLISFRTCQPNHKSGSISAPTGTFGLNPYNTSVSLPTTYSASSTVINVDIASLTEEAQGRFFGYIKNGTKLVGKTSGATATVSNIRLISDNVGNLQGSFFFRDPLSRPVPAVRFKNGEKTFRLTSSSTNEASVIGAPSVSVANATYSTSGVVDTLRQTQVVIRQLPPPPAPVFITNVFQTINVNNGDPLAQSFTVDETGAFVTSVDIFMRKKDVKEQLTVQLRTMELGTPTLIQVQEFAQVVLDPSQINVSEDASVATNVKFPSPIYLEGGQEYCIVLLAPTTNNYEAWISRMGDPTIETQSLPDSESVIVSQQYIGGSLFKSQNGSIWTPSQFEDMKIKINKAKFTTTDGTAFFYNPELDYESQLVPSLNNNAIKSYPRKLKLGITKTTTSATVNSLVSGVKISEGSAAATAPMGTLERVGSEIATSNNALSVSVVGAGYSNGVYTNVDLFAITGAGSSATGIVTVSGGVLQSVSVTSSAKGHGYSKGDIVGLATADMISGGGAQISVDTISGVDTLYLTNVQGENYTLGQDLVVNGAVPQSGAVDITSNEVVSDLFTGNVIEVSQYSHGMTAGNNKVEISNVSPTTEPAPLTAELGLNDNFIVVGSTNISKFSTFEGITTSRGYVQVNNEIIRYDAVGVSSIGIAERGVNGTAIREHPIGSLALSYQFNGLSLTGINTVHDMPSSSLLTQKKDIDNYFIEIPRGSGRTGLPDLSANDIMASFTDERSGGGAEIHASKNIQFNSVFPRFNTLQPGKTSLSSQIRTVSGTSVGGSESSFLDQGYEDIELNKINPLTSTRLVASPVNETARLSDLPKNRSTTLSMRFTTSDENLSPVVDTMNGSLIFGRSRLNKPVSDYANDERVKLIVGDPHSGIYISNRVDLKTPATSIKVLISSDRKTSADFRALFKLFRPDSEGIEQSYELFPGFDNLTDTDGDGFGDEVIDGSKNSGRADSKVPANTSGEFVDYQFTADNLSEFTGFQIKIVFNGTNEAEAPKFKDLRVIALA